MVFSLAICGILLPLLFRFAFPQKFSLKYQCLIILILCLCITTGIFAFLNSLRPFKAPIPLLALCLAFTPLPTFAGFWVVRKSPSTDRLVTNLTIVLTLVLYYLLPYCMNSEYIDLLTEFFSAG